MSNYQNNQYGYPYNAAYGYGGPCIPPNAMMWTQAPMPSGGVPYPQAYAQRSGMTNQAPVEPPHESNPSAQEQIVSEPKEMAKYVPKDGNVPEPHRQRERETNIIPVSQTIDRMNYKKWEKQQELFLYEAKQIVHNASDLQHIEAESRLKECIAEKKAERKRSQYQKIEIRQNGEVTSRTENLLTGGQSRMVTNFKTPQIYALRSSSGEEGFFRLEFEVEEKHCIVYLQEARCGESGYLLKKIQAAGGVFQANKRSERCEYVSGFWAALLEAEVPVDEIPEIYGWNQSSNGEFRFVKEGEILWNDVKRQAS